MRGSGACEKGGGELRKGLVGRRAPIGIARPPPRQMRDDWERYGDEDVDDGYGYTPFPRLKRRREVIDLGPLPPRPWEVDGRVDTDSGEVRKGKNKGKGKGKQRRRGLFGWFGS